MGAPAPSYVRFMLRGSLRRADVPALCDRVSRLLAESGAAEVLCDVSAVECDAVTVDALARIQLTTRRRGHRMRLRGACPQLRSLVAFMGLEDVLTQVEEGE
jgi:ABC-type transporter Mla MlaB component